MLQNWRNRGWVIVASAAAVAVPAVAGFVLGCIPFPPVEIAQVACGLPKQTVSFTLPAPLFDASTQGAADHRLPVWVGPFRHQGTDDVVRLRFGADSPGDATSVSRIGDVLHLPINLGDPADPPRRILLHCRNDALAHVQYVTREGIVRDFPVIRTAVAGTRTGSGTGGEMAEK